MKNSTLAWSRMVKYSLVLALACWPGLLTAAEKTVPPASTSDTPPPSYDLQIVDGQLIRPQGKVEATLGNVVDALRDHYTEANIILSPGLSKLKVGDLKMRAGRLVDELEGVRVACGEKFVMQTPGASIPQQVDPNTGLQVGGAPPNGGLFVLREAAPARTQRIVEAFNVGPYLEWLHQQPKEGAQRGHEQESVEELETIIADTLSRSKTNDENQDKPDFAYHPGASLLIVIGNVDSVEIARKIVNALPGMGSARNMTVPVNNMTGDPAAQRRAAEDAFRARYGLQRRPAPANEGDPPVPDSQQKK